MAALVSSYVAECAGCTEYVEPFGPELVVLGLAVSLAMIAPFGLLHRVLRSRGR